MAPWNVLAPVTLEARFDMHCLGYPLTTTF